MSKKKTTEQNLLLQTGTITDMKRDMKRGTRMFEMLAEAFTSPIIGHPGWVDTITKEQKDRIQIERLKQIAASKGEKLMEATDYEAMVYLMTASLAAPLGRHFYSIYTWLFRKFYPDKAKTIFEKYEGQKLDLVEQQDLHNLKRWLLRTSNKHADRSQPQKQKPTPKNKTVQSKLG